MTEDQTETLWSEYFDEACHNLSGAYDETVYNYIEGCSLPELLLTKKNVSVLDVGFGVGVGLKALIDLVKNSNSEELSLSYYSIELDEELTKWSLQSTLPFLKLNRTESHSDLLLSYEGQWSESNKLINIKIFIGDGRKTLPKAFQLKALEPVDAIFQDAFSPRKNPSLWSVEWFTFLKQISNLTVQLSTYSSSVSIRKSLLAAGWQIFDTKGFAFKKSMTKARLSGETSPELLLRMSRSPSLEIRDK
jgi:chorismate dehydratase